MQSIDTGCMENATLRTENIPPNREMDVDSATHHDSAELNIHQTYARVLSFRLTESFSSRDVLKPQYTTIYITCTCNNNTQFYAA